MPCSTSPARWSSSSRARAHSSAGMTGCTGSPPRRRREMSTARTATVRPMSTASAAGQRPAIGPRTKSRTSVLMSRSSDSPWSAVRTDRTVTGSGSLVSSPSIGPAGVADSGRPSTNVTVTAGSSFLPAANESTMKVCRQRRPSGTGTSGGVCAARTSNVPKSLSSTGMTTSTPTAATTSMVNCSGSPTVTVAGKALTVRVTGPRVLLTSIRP